MHLVKHIGFSLNNIIDITTIYIFHRLWQLSLKYSRLISLRYIDSLEYLLYHISNLIPPKVQPDIILRYNIGYWYSDDYDFVLVLRMVQTKAISFNLIVLDDIVEEVVLDVGVSGVPTHGVER